MISISRSLISVAALLSLAASPLLAAADTNDPNKDLRAAAAVKTYQPAQKVNPLPLNPLKQYEDAMRPIYDLTIQETTASLKKAPNDAALYARRASAHSSKKDYKNALPDYDSSLKLNPDQPALYPKRAIANYMLKNYDKSWEDVHESEKRGADLPAPFLEALKKTSGRQK